MEQSFIVVRYVRDDNFADPMMRAFASPHAAFVFVQQLESDQSVLEIESHCVELEDVGLYA